MCGMVWFIAELKAAEKYVYHVFMTLNTTIHEGIVFQISLLFR